MTRISLCPYGHAHCRGRGFCGIERWGWRDRRRLKRFPACYRTREWVGFMWATTAQGKAARS